MVFILIIGIVGLMITLEGYYKNVIKRNKELSSDEVVGFTIFHVLIGIAIVALTLTTFWYVSNCR